MMLNLRESLASIEAARVLGSRIVFDNQVHVTYVMLHALVLALTVSTAPITVPSSWVQRLL
jgi:hypothetical protein